MASVRAQLDFCCLKVSNLLNFCCSFLGANVVILDRNEKRGQALMSELNLSHLEYVA